MHDRIDTYMLLRTVGLSSGAGVIEAERRVRDVGLSPELDVLVQGDAEPEVHGGHAYHMVRLLGTMVHINLVLRHNHTLTTIDQD